MQSCEAVLGDARLDTSDQDAPPGVDSDGDRIPDVDDNCKELANPLQENEDGDALGDACDPCPILDKYGVNNLDANVDSDGDGVGNGCDPNPNSNTERAVYFTGFNEMPSGAVTTGATFTFSGGAATSAPGANELSNLSVTVPGFDPSRKLYLFTGEQILAYANAVTVRTSGAALFADPAGGSGWACGPGDVGGSGRLALVSFDAAGDNQQGTATATTTVGTVFESLISRTGSSGSVVCSSPTVGAFTGAMPQVANAIGIHARSMSVAFRYLYLVDSTSP